MTPQQVVGLGVRLFAVWLALRSIQYLVAIPQSLAQHGLAGVPLAYFIGFAYLIAAILFWTFPMTVAHKLVPRTQFAEPLRLPALDAARVGCVLLGLWALIQSGPALVSLAFRAYIASGSGAVVDGQSPDQKLDLVAYVGELVIAAILLTRPAVVARLLMGERGPNKAPGTN